MPEVALQVFLREAWLDAPTTARTFRAYVVSLARVHGQEAAQMWVSQLSGRTTPRDGDRNTRDRILSWGGSGQLVFSAPLQGFDGMDLDLYLIRDKERSRRAGTAMAGFGADTDAGGALRDIIGVLGKAAEGANVAGAVLSVVGDVVNVIGKVLANQGDQVLIEGHGSLTRELLLRGRDRIRDADATQGMAWGEGGGSKGFFRIGVFTRDVEDATISVRPAQFPPEIAARLARSVIGGTG
jgi:hypothetical protein